MNKKEKRMKRKWFVQHGPGHHYINTKAFNQLRKARVFINSLEKHNYCLSSQDFKSAYGTGENERIIELG